MQNTPFGSDDIIIPKISEPGLFSYLVGFDIDDNNQKIYRWKDFTGKLERVIPEYAFGWHLGEKVSITDVMDIAHEAANSIYEIEEFTKTREIYINNSGYIEDNSIDKNYLKRGEFGEIILHLLLRDFHSTVPLLSKIFFKDTDGMPVHGFDAIHIQNDGSALWLGESKLYIDGKNGVAALINDIKDHIKGDYLNREFTLIAKKMQGPYNIPEKDHWVRFLQGKRKLADRLKVINIPLLCCYTSDNFSLFDDETLPDFIEAYTNEIHDLKKYFDDHNDHPLKSRLNLFLLLFPVKCKNELVRRMHQKLTLLQEK